MRKLLRRLSYLINGQRRESDLAEEMAFHREMTARELESNGAAPADARLAARRAFGSTPLAQDRARDVWIPPAFQGIAQDFRVAARMLWTTRVVSAVAIFSLALGIGANTAIFSLINSAVLRTLPVANPGRLALLVNPGQISGVPLFIGYPVWKQIRDRSGALAGAAVWADTTFNLTSGGHSELVRTIVASGSFFDTLGVTAATGRAFSDADDATAPAYRGGGPVAVISYGLWQRRFGAAADVIGGIVTLDRVPFTIVGVTPREFFGPEPGRTFDVIVPIGTEPRLHPQASWVSEVTLGGPFRLIVRLPAGQPVVTATAALRAWQPQVREATMPPDWPARYRDQYLKTPFTLMPLSDANWPVRRRFERPLVTMLAIVALVLLVASGNLASLLLARARARRTELSVRWALGASRWRLVRQLLAESVLLAGAGGGLGLVIAAAVGRALVRQMSSAADPIYLDLSIDRYVLAFAITVTALTATVFGIAPAWRYTRRVATEGLNAGGHERAGGTNDRFSSSLIVAQVGVSLALVFAAGLLGRTFASLASRQLGFDADRLVAVDISMEHSDVAAADREGVFVRVLEATRALPEVADAAISFNTPIAEVMLSQPIEAISGVAPLSGGRNTLTALNVVSPRWFTTVGIPILTGRDISDADLGNTPPVIVVNRAFAQRFLAGADPVGHTVKLALPGPPRPPAQVVGVAGDAVYGTLRAPVPATIYMPIAQLASLPGGGRYLTRAYLTVRIARGAPATMFASLAAALAQVNPNLGFTFHTLQDQIADSLRQERVLALISVLVGGLALLLAALGVYGVSAYAVIRRRREFGIRMALGARPADVGRLVLGRVAAPVALGVAAGALASIWASRLIGALLYDVRPGDPVTLAGSAAVLASVAIVATWAPAQRAARIDPALTLRCD